MAPKTENTENVVSMNLTKYPFLEINPSQRIINGSGVSGTTATWAYTKGATYSGTLRLPPFIGSVNDSNDVMPTDRETEAISNWICNLGNIRYVEPNSEYNSGNEERHGDYFKNLSQYETEQFNDIEIGITIDDFAAMNETQNIPGYYCWFTCAALGGHLDYGICLDYTNQDNTTCNDISATAGSKAANGHVIRRFCQFEYIGNNNSLYSLNQDLILPINSR